MNNQSQNNSNEQFIRFARYLADKVLVAINSGIKITVELGGYCPLGVLVDPDNTKRVELHRPNGAEARLYDKMVEALPSMAPTAFADGFDGTHSEYWANYEPAYVKCHELGKAYREHFKNNRHKE